MRTGALVATFAVLLLAGFPFAATAGMDFDGTPDIFDTCKLDPFVPVPCSIDDDMDGYGNACDCDLTNDGLRNGLDVGPLIECLISGSDPGSLGCDFNCDGIPGDGLDFQIFLPH